MVRNPEIVFVADLTRADAPALVMTTQCELVMKSSAEGSQMTAVIKELKVCMNMFYVSRKMQVNSEVLSYAI